MTHAHAWIAGLALALPLVVAAGWLLLRLCVAWVTLD
ncbi:hypothetical protein EV670_0602 [Rivibacter subsaxonicus]|uniref:Uncharacterized protein n=1 Tax=Rivibacter subsaxonicus TaxID=457575 RepID=A0A4Q7W055_9BURK|nr:hypothetical protein EV670_0602 [Rivibacter subsaxonicus]